MKPAEFHDITPGQTRLNIAGGVGIVTDLFGQTEPAPAKPAKAPRPIWSDLAASTRTRCDLCLDAVDLDNYVTPSSARLRRRFGHADQRLCYPHAQPIRDADDALADQTKRKAKRG